jgi:hypothetical protein
MTATLFSSDVLRRLSRSVMLSGFLFLTLTATDCGGDDGDGNGGTGPSADCIDELNFAGLPFDEDDVEAIGTNDSESGSITENDVEDAGYYADIYVIGADENGELTITGNPSGFDLLLLLFDEDFEILGGADSEDPDATEELVADVDDGACYYIIVTTYEEGETGSYTLATDL